MNKPLVHIEEGLDYPVTLFQTGKKLFKVQYGAQITGDLDWIDAAHRLGECVFHSLECANKIKQ